MPMPLSSNAVQIAWRVSAILRREFNRIHQLALVQLQGCVAIGDQKIWAKTAAGLVINLINKVFLGGQGQS